MQLMDYIEAKKILERYKVHSVESRYVKSADDAVEFSRGRRIVMKVLSDKALHKSKAGLVMLDLETESDIRRAFAALAKKAQKLRPYKVIVQLMSEPGSEIIIGGRTDQQFGKVILIGLGGVYVEVFRDFALRIAPLTRNDTADMLAQMKSSQIVTRNGKHTALIQDLLLRVSKLMQEHGEIDELDLNPVIITDSGYQIVDIRMLKRERK